MISTAGFDYYPAFLPVERADELLDTLWRDLPWKQYEISLFGRRVPQPRLTAWCSDPGVSYRYSGLTLPPTPLHPELDALRNKLQSRLGIRFNSVLANAYRDGRDSMGWHADNEPELGQDPVIASLSLGEVRRFLIRHRSGGRSAGMELGHGSLLLMSGHSQRDTVHSLPKTRKNKELRISLTYRRIRLGLVRRGSA